MGIDSSLFIDGDDDPKPVEPLSSLLELHQKISESGRLKKKDYEGAPKRGVSDIELPKREPQSETDSFSAQKPYAP